MKWMRRRQKQGYCNNLIQELLLEDTREYQEMMRMSHETFMQIFMKD